MGLRNDTLLIGADGGGTSCRVGLIAPLGRFDIKLGPANATSDLGQAVSNVCLGVRQVADMAGLGIDALVTARVHIALAGVKNTSDEKAIARGVQRHLGLRHVNVSEDFQAVVRGALGGQDGVVAAIGTGSFVARVAQGHVQRVGGWGRDLGDQASGAWLGHKALMASLLACDGMAKNSELCDQLLERFGSPEGMTEFAATAGPSDYGGLAPLVVQAAQAGDEVGRKLMQEGGDYVGRAIAVLGYCPGDGIVLTGGLGAKYSSWLSPAYQTDLRSAQGSALDGALALARDMVVKS